LWNSNWWSLGNKLRTWPVELYPSRFDTKDVVHWWYECQVDIYYVVQSLAYVSWVQASACTPVTLAVPYLPTRLVGCLVGPGISRGARKLVWTPRVIKKKKRRIIIILSALSVGWCYKYLKTASIFHFSSQHLTYVREIWSKVPNRN